MPSADGYTCIAQDNAAIKMSVAHIESTALYLWMNEACWVNEDSTSMVPRMNEMNGVDLGYHWYYECSEYNSYLWMNEVNEDKKSFSSDRCCYQHHYSSLAVEHSYIGCGTQP